LTKSIQNIILFKDAKLSLSNKSIYGLIGRNGIGKTTLLKELSQITNQDYYKY
jgi:ABC-type multidrug transport system ATPase subunit